MKGLLLFGTLVALAVSSQGIRLENEADVYLKSLGLAPQSHETREYVTRLDHFRPQDTRNAVFTYTQKLDHYRPGGPIYFYINDGGSFTTAWLDTGLMHDIAMEEGAALITSGHRFFGNNLPTDDASFENLEFLTLEQSLGDIAILLNVIREDLGSSRVILWGSGYGGTLAVMARQKFPHLVNAVWSSSGIFTPAVYLRDTFLHTETVIRRYGGETCANQIRDAFDEIDEMINYNRGEELGEMLGLCHPVNTSSDLSLGSLISGQIEMINYYLNVYNYYGLLNLCDGVSSADGESPVEAYGRWLQSAFTGFDCFDFEYYYRLELASNTEWNQPGTNYGIRQWYYYKCTQLGLWEVTSFESDLFPDRVRDTFYYYLCQDAFGENYDSALLYDSVAALEILYGSLNPGVTNVVYTNGEMDMWFPLGIRNVTGPGAEVFNIPYYAKSADLRSLSDFDGVELQIAKNRIRQLVREWGTSS